MSRYDERLNLSTETDFDAINARYSEKVLANGWRVLAHVVKGEVEPYRFSNVTEAQAKAAMFAGAWVTISRPFYVRLPVTDGRSVVAHTPV